MTRILLVRHGESEWNAVGRWQGQADPPLSEVGRRQAFMAAERIGAVDAVVSSDLERAVQTAFIIGEALGVGPVITDERLRERDAGEWSGLTKAEIEQQWPGYLSEHRRPPRFEPEHSFLARTHAGLAAIHDRFEGADVFCVAHGGLMYALEREADKPVERLANLAGRWIIHHGDRIELGERLVLVDDTFLTTVPAQI